MKEYDIYTEEQDPNDESRFEFVNADDTDDDEEEKSHEKTVLVPDVIDMDTYFHKHYDKQLITELNELLADGSIAEKTGRDIVSERILPEECSVKTIRYWGESRETFYIDLEVRLELKVRSGNDTDTDFFWFYVIFWFCFDDVDEECSLHEFGLLENRKYLHYSWRLDKYLVPVFRRDEIEFYAPEIWKKYLPEAADNPEARYPDYLCNAMGLTVVYHRLSDRPHTRGIIFFEDGRLLTQPEPFNCRRKDPVEVQVKAKPIVLNSDTDSDYDYNLDLYHECIHYEWHYLFYKLQSMHNSDIEQLSTSKLTVKKDKASSGPVSFMESQARLGSYCLMMPKAFMLDTIKKLNAEYKPYARKKGYFDHDGFRFEYMIRMISGKYQLSKARIKARMKQLGFTAAVGALNYVDGRYITPFALSDPDNCKNGRDYVIDRKNVHALYKSNKKFRDLMQSGQFTFVDGHIVYNKTEAEDVIYTASGARLSPWANAHADEVCLPFDKKYTEAHKCRYTYRQMNSDEDLKNSMRFLSSAGTLSVKDAQKMKDRLMEDMPLSFHGALSYIMKGRVTVDDLKDRIPLSRNTILRLRTEERPSYELDQVIALCIGLNLPPWLSEILLDKAGLTVKRYGPKGYYGVILDCFYMDTINEVQKFLEDNGYPELRLNFDPEVEYGKSAS